MTAWARTPAGAQSSCSQRISGTSRCSARTNAGLLKLRHISSKPIRQWRAAIRQKPRYVSHSQMSREIDVGVAIAFAGPGEHRVGAAFEPAVDQLREVDAEEREIRVGTGIDQRFDQMVGIRLERVKLAAEREDSRRTARRRSAA